MYRAYVCGRELLLCGEDGTATLSSVERALAFDCGFALSSSWSTDLAANLGGALPVVRHCCGVGGGKWLCGLY